MFSESDNFIDNVTQVVLQNQGLHFASQREAQQHLDKTRTEIRSLMRQSNALFVEGLNHLAQNSLGHAHPYVATVAAKMLKNLDSAKKLKKIIDADVIGRELSLLFFSDAVNAFYDCGDYHKELCVISVLIALFPLNAQPYVYYGSLLWRKEGKESAEMFYSKIIEVIHDPALDYFAADCFIKNGNGGKARELLQNAQKNPLMAEDIYKNVKQHIHDLIGQCQPG